MKRVLTLLAALTACSFERPADVGPSDGPAVDASAVDAPAVDAPAVDAPAVDAPIDARPIDAPVVMDGPPPDGTPARIIVGRNKRQVNFMMDPNAVWFLRVVPPRNGRVVTLNTIVTNFSSSHRFRMALYEDGGQHPGALVAGTLTAEGIPGSTGIVTFQITDPVTIVPTKAYWIAVITNNAVDAKADTEIDNVCFVAWPFGTMLPGQFPGATCANTNGLNLYLELE